MLTHWRTVNNYQIPDGESVSQVAERMFNLFKAINKDYQGKNILLVSHGDDIKLAEKTVDLHKDVVDAIGFECPKCQSQMKRISEVLDCWFESGSMPYAQFHYPFESKDKFKKTFPADFIAEGVDQTRGWFYTLMVLSTALFDEPAFRHCVVNGIVLAEDGKKMSKRLKNYPEPMELVEKHGADAIRFTLMSSPAVRGEDLRFSERSVEE